MKFGRALEFIFSRRPIIFFLLLLRFEFESNFFLFPRDEKEHARTTSALDDDENEDD